MAAAIDGVFGSFEAFRDHFGAAALSSRAPDGPSWPTSRSAATIVIEQLYDQQGNIPVGTLPLLMLAMWGHALLPGLRQRQADYVKTFGS